MPRASAAIDHAFVASGGGLGELDGVSFEAGADDDALKLEEVEELAVLIEGIDDDLDAATLALEGQGQVSGVDGLEGPADELGPEAGVAVPAHPVRGPAAAGVGREGDGAAQAVGPVGEHGGDLAGTDRQGRDDGDFDQLVLLEGGLDQAGDAGEFAGEADDGLAVGGQIDGPGLAHAFVDEGAGDEAGFFLIDTGQGLGVGDVVEAALGATGQVLHREHSAGVAAVGGDEHAGDGDLVGDELADDIGLRGRRDRRH